MRLECVVEFDAPGIVRIFAFISFGCEVVVSVEFDVLQYSYACFSDPELHIFIASEVQLVAHVQSGAAKERGALVSLDIVSAEGPGADFVGIDFAVGEASGPESCITKRCILCLHIVAVDGEVTDAIGETCAPSGCGLACCSIVILFLSVLQVESRNISCISDVTCQLAIPSFSGINVFPVITNWITIGIYCR